MADLWEWIHQIVYAARADHDDTKIEMVSYLYKMFKVNKSDPELALHYIEQGRQLAKIVGHDWFVQLMNHWELQIRFRYLGDFTGTLDLATRSTVEVRHPHYAALPQRICLYEDLIVAYTETDPVGYHDQIEDALDYMEQSVEPKSDCFLCLNNLKRDFRRATHTTEEITKIALSDLQAAQESQYHLAYIYIDLAEMAYRQHDWGQLLTWATEAQTVASNVPRFKPTALLWQALHAHQMEDILREKSLYQRAIHAAEHYPPYLGKAYYIALTAYHEHGGRPDEALDTQVAYYQRILNTAQPFQECTALLEMIRLKKGLEQDFEDDVAALKETVKSLKAPDYILAKLKTITA